jgi:phosphoribosylformimino-5-aminoimidazole carboxamide ribonucleotide (ProFAR) isomerase
MLEGPVEEIISEAKQIEKASVDGLTLSAYRYRGNPEELSQEFVKEIQIPIIITGSINNYERLDLIKSLNPWGFTVGSAFFNKDFGKNLTLAGQIERVVDYIGD